MVSEDQSQRQVLSRSFLSSSVQVLPSVITQALQGSKQAAVFRIPALVDHTSGDLAIFESGAIMWWLASRDPEGKLFPKDPAKQAEVMSWLMFQMVTFSPSEIIAGHEIKVHWSSEGRTGTSYLLPYCMAAQGGVGPMQGQANHFLRYAPVKIDYGINRYVNETNRLYQVRRQCLKLAIKALREQAACNS